MELTQKQIILNYMETFGSITPLDALREFGCMRLAARISELIKDGHNITSEMESNENRFGQKVHYSRYRLVA